MQPYTPQQMMQAHRPASLPPRQPGFTSPQIAPMNNSGGVAAQVGGDPRMYASSHDPRMYASPGGVDPRMYNSGGVAPQVPNGGPPSNNLYGSYEMVGGVDHRMYASSGGSAEPMQPIGVGVGIRVEYVESNGSRELAVAKVIEGGSAHRNGTIQVGDILLSVGQTAVQGYTLIQLRPFMLGPPGSLVVLTFKNRNFAHQYTVELMRGDNLYFLHSENQTVAAKLDIFKKQNDILDGEMDNMRTILAQADARGKMSSGEVENLQTRYQELQNAIENCNKEISNEQHQQADLREQLKEENPHKPTIRQYGEKLTRVENELQELMAILEAEQEAAVKLLEELDQENEVTEIVIEKIHKHEGLVVQSSHFKSDVEQAVAQRQAELEDLRKKIAETEAEYRSANDDFPIFDADSNALQTKVEMAQKEYQDLESKLLDVRNTSEQSQSEHKLALSKGQRLIEKQDLLRAVADKRQQASSGLQRSVDLENERMQSIFEDTVAERNRSRDAALRHQQDLRMQVDSMKDMKVQIQNKMLTIATDFETSIQNKRFEISLEEDKLEILRRATDKVQAECEKRAGKIRDMQQQAIGAQEASVIFAEEEKKHVAEIRNVHTHVAEIDREFNHLFTVAKTRDDYWRGLKRDHDEAVNKIQSCCDQVQREIRELQGDITHTHQESLRYKTAADKISEAHRAFEQRKAHFQRMRLDHVNETEQIIQGYQNLSGELASLEQAINPGTYFQMSHVTGCAVHEALHSAERVKLDYAAARSRLAEEYAARMRGKQVLGQNVYERTDGRDRDHIFPAVSSFQSSIPTTSLSYTDQLTSFSAPTPGRAYYNSLDDPSLSKWDVGGLTKGVAEGGKGVSESDQMAWGQASTVVHRPTHEVTSVRSSYSIGNTNVITNGIHPSGGSNAPVSTGSMSVSFAPDHWLHSAAKSQRHASPPPRAPDSQPLSVIERHASPVMQRHASPVMERQASPVPQRPANISQESTTHWLLQTLKKGSSLAQGSQRSPTSPGIGPALPPRQVPDVVQGHPRMTLDTDPTSKVLTSAALRDALHGSRSTSPTYRAAIYSDLC